MTQQENKVIYQNQPAWRTEVFCATDGSGTSYSVKTDEKSPRIQIELQNGNRFSRPLARALGSALLAAANKFDKSAPRPDHNTLSFLLGSSEHEDAVAQGNAVCEDVRGMGYDPDKVFASLEEILLELNAVASGEPDQKRVIELLQKLV